MQVITPGTQIKIVKGCRARNLSKGTRGTVTAVTELGADYSHQVRVTIQIPGRTIAWCARHINRLSDPTVRLNDGNPLHTIEIKPA